ncbi:hypothetical protein glysoja_008917 [Glycine soja]|nr:hypothetical protein glysoja_008917 [Glycine soja]
MPRKGMRSIFFTSTPTASLPPPSRQRTFSDSLMDENIETAEKLITKWDDSKVTTTTQLFSGTRQEAKQYLNAVKGLQSAMQYLVAQDSTSSTLVRAQFLMQLAMKTLQKEFYQILSSNREHLDPETVSTRSSVDLRSVSDYVSDYDDEISITEDEFRVSETERVSMLAMEDLKAIAECMISSGYGKECVKVYIVMRKSIVDEALYHLGVEKLNLSQVQKLDWEVLELKIKSWLKAVKVAVGTLFHGERILCDHVFAGEKNRGIMFRGNHQRRRRISFGISGNGGEVQEIAGKNVQDSGFSHRRNRSLAVVFSYVMNYLTFLADYSGVLVDIIADLPQSPLPESYYRSPMREENPPASELSERIAWIILVVLCKLDGKAELYKDVAHSYLFLANNMQYVVVKVRKSNLGFLLGEEWLAKHELKVREYTSKYESVGWSAVFSSLPENPAAELTAEQARACFVRFDAAFHEACKKQASWVVSDPKFRDEIKDSIASKLMQKYSVFFEKNRLVSHHTLRQPRRLPIALIDGELGDVADN